MDTDALMVTEPDGFRRDPYGYLTNQAGHAYLVGLPAALIVSPWWGLMATPVIIGAIYGVVWEWALQGGRYWRDSLEDTVHVTVGASVICAALSGDRMTVIGCMVAQAILLAIGVWRRS
jgi:hypothetical protein